MSDDGVSESGAVDEAPAHKPPPPSQAFGGGRFGAGMPTEKSKDFAGSTRRLLRTMSPERLGAIGVLVAAIVSVALAVSGPKILGRGTDVIVSGIFGHTGGIQFDRLRNILLLAIAVYAASSVLSYIQSYL